MRGPWRIYFVYQHALFAQGLRSLLAAEQAIAFVGLEDDLVQARVTGAALDADLILIEERADHAERALLQAFLRCGRAVVTVTHEGTGTLHTGYESKRFRLESGGDLLAQIQQK